MRFSSWNGLWLLLALGAGMGLEFLHADSFHPLVHPADLVSLSLPARVQFVAPIVNPRFSGPALVFDVPSFSLTCYFRHPPRAWAGFGGDVYSIAARIELTPTGKLCVVQEMHSHVDD